MSINATDNLFVCLLAERRLGIIIIFSSSMDGGSVHNRFTCELNGFKLSILTQRNTNETGT